MCVRFIFFYNGVILILWFRHFNDVDPRFPDWSLFILTVLCSMITNCRHRLPVFFNSHCTAACLYAALPYKQCLLLFVFTRGFTHCPIAVYLHDTDPGFLCFFLLSFFFVRSLQVKVWFQNRRTKFKRQKLEEEGSESQQKKKGSHHINRWRLATKQASPEEIDVTSDD